MKFIVDNMRFARAYYNQTTSKFFPTPLIFQSSD